MVGWAVVAAVLAAEPPTPAAIQQPGQGEAAVVRVTVLSDSTPLPAARVSAAGRSARTDGRGLAVLALPGGPHRLVVARLGFLPDTLDLLLRSGQDTALTVTLEAAAAEMEELVVTTTRTERRVEDQPLRVEVLGTEEVEEKLLMTPGDITMLLNETGGLRVQTTSPSLGGANARIQGLRGRYTLLLADGLPLYGQSGGLGLLQIPPMDLGQVEIVKGPASALYGPAALGGVINLVSRRPASEHQILLNGTTLGGADAVGFFGGRLAPGVGYTMLAGAHRQGRRDRDGDGWSDVPGYERAVVRPRLFATGGSGASVYATAGVVVERREGGTLEGRLAPDGAPFAERLRTERFDGGAVARLPLGGAALLQIRASGMTAGHRHRFGDVEEPDRHTTWFGETALTWTHGTAAVVVGAAFTAERYGSDAFPGFDYDHRTPGGFAQVELELPWFLALAASARVDAHNVYGSHWSPRLSLLRRLGESWALRATWGAGSFAPTPFTEETEVTGLSRLAPLAGLRAESARSVGVDLTGLAGSFEVSGALFATTVRHAVQLVDSPGGIVQLINAAGPTHTTGGDALVRYRRAPLMVTASYTYTHAREPDPAGSGRREVPLTPRHSAGLVAVWEREDWERVGLEAYLTGRQALEDNPFRTRSRTYLIIGLLGERRIGPARLFVNFENLTGARQTRFDPLVRPVRGPDGRWTTDAWAPLEGMVANGGLRLAF